MNVADLLCQSFCGGLSVSPSPAGYCVETVFEDTSGDRLTFYVVSNQNGPGFRIEDDGSLVPLMIASGNNVLKGTRQSVFQRILADAQIEYDEESGELHSGWLKEEEIATAAFRFVDALIKLHGLKNPLRQESVANTFREDAMRKISSVFAPVAEIDSTGVVAPSLGDFMADVVLRRDGHAPVAVFFGVSEQRLWEAIALKMASLYEGQPCSVVGLVESSNTKMVSKGGIARSSNRLDTIAYFRDEEDAAMARIGWEMGLGGKELHLH